ncbi:cysteine-rich protein [Elephant endotheliotropic herpesvirus 5B]|uniref:Protein UL49 n=3 Tax=Elephant endotheliotropic herpesvirus 5 TaxID=768738 RepID=A0A075CYP5_9BETA|nr:protein UL49 [Elephant endotheliotropic herpesvirus 5]AHC02842.1 protein UL49 [Elephant endotheliotropic herpesvirus 5]UVZ35244.1 cysteine-rich protein [Elephant endotheliotropic herpesvirus 5B]
MEFNYELFFKQMSALCVHHAAEHMQTLVFGYAFNDNCPLAWFKTEQKSFRRFDIMPYWQRFLAGGDEFDACDLVFTKRQKTVQVFGWLLYMYFVLCMHEISKVLNFGILNSVVFRKIEIVYAMLMGHSKKLPDLTLYMFNKMNIALFGMKLTVPIIWCGISNKVKLVNIKYYNTCFAGRRTKAMCGNNSESDRVNDSYNFISDEYHRRLRAPAYSEAWRDLRIDWLVGQTSDLPGGNFLCAMIRALIDHYCSNTDRYIVPIVHDSQIQSPLSSGGTDVAGQNRKDLYRYALARSLRTGLVTSVIELPLLCIHKVKCEVLKKDVRVIVCQNCGYCLNIGKIKLKNEYMFNLNSVFYYRDQQEKAVNYSMHYDVPHCSLCGSMNLKIISLYEGYMSELYDTRVYVCIWRAVIGTNNGCTIFNNKTLDIILPCSNRFCYNTTALKDLHGISLLNLLNHKSSFLCSTCSVQVPSPAHVNDSVPVCAACELVKHEQQLCSSGGAGCGTRTKKRTRSRRTEETSIPETF